MFKSNARNVRRMVAATVLASLVVATADSDAAAYRTRWDPEFNTAFSLAESGFDGVGWRGTAVVTVDDGCLMPDTLWDPPEAPCTSAVLNYVSLEMYNIETDALRFNFEWIGDSVLQALSQLSIDDDGDVDGVTFSSAVLTSTLPLDFSQIYNVVLNMTLTGPSLTLTTTEGPFIEYESGEFPVIQTWALVPEPTSLALIGVALAALGFIRRRKV